MLKDLAVTYKKVVRIFKIIFAYNGEIAVISRWTGPQKKREREREEDFISILCSLACQLVSEIHSDGPGSEL